MYLWSENIYDVQRKYELIHGKNIIGILTVRTEMRSGDSEDRLHGLIFGRGTRFKGINAAFLEPDI
jgi:hypothetical protein